MTIITIHSQKGGSGKSTLAANIYIQAVHDNRSAAVFDLDPQASVTHRFEQRQRTLVELMYGDVPRAMPMDEVIASIRDLDKELVILDTEPRSSERYVALARESDLVIVPVRPTVMDLEATADTVSVLKTAGALDRALFVIAQAPAKRGLAENPDVIETQDVLDSYGLDVASTIIRNRRDYSRSLNDGRGVVEAFPAGKAATEIKEFWKTIKERI